MENEKLQKVLAFDVGKYLERHAQFFEERPGLNNDPEYTKALAYWNEYTEFITNCPDPENVRLPADLEKKVNEAHKIFALKTLENDLLRLKSESVVPITSKDFARLRLEIYEFFEAEKRALLRNIEAGFSSASEILKARLAAGLEVIEPELFQRKGLFYPIEKGTKGTAFKSLGETLLAQWIANELERVGDHTKKTTDRLPDPIQWTESRKSLYYLFHELKKRGFIAQTTTYKEIAQWLKVMFKNLPELDTVKRELERRPEAPPKKSAVIDEIFGESARLDETEK
ncbi:MAG: hypothetical protein U0U46_16300 [Saprospiraceae bacterium]